MPDDLLDENPKLGPCCGCGTTEHAHRYRCEACGERGVFGADEVLLAMAI